MCLVDQHTRRPGGQPLLNTDSVWHSKGHIAKPGVAVETDQWHVAGAIVPISNHAMSNHCAAKKLDGGILLRGGKLCQPGGLWYLCDDSTMRAVGCLLYPPAECQFRLFDEIE